MPQIVQHLGFIFNSSNMTVTKTEQKKNCIQSLARKLLNTSKPTIQQLASFIGKLVACEPGFVHVPIIYKSKFSRTKCWGKIEAILNWKKSFSLLYARKSPGGYSMCTRLRSTLSSQLLNMSLSQMPAIVDGVAQQKLIMCVKKPGLLVTWWNATSYQHQRIKGCISVAVDLLHQNRKERHSHQIQVG